MIIVRLQGGLGNQLFQFALGRSFSLRNKVDVRYDFEYFSFDQNDHGITLWPYVLNKFNLNVKRGEGLKFSFFKSIGKIGVSGYNINEKNFSNYTYEKIAASQSGYFDGYWQSQIFFNDFKTEIRDEIRSGYQFNSNNKELLKKMATYPSCSVHIRRGDFLNASVDGFNKDSIDYYRKAFDYVEERINDVNFYVFSDDLAWAEENLKCANPIHFIDINKGDDSHQDMMLMSNCDHNILANSTFSWWGTFLNQNENKIVIAPSKWPKGCSINIKCDNWIILK